MDNYNSIRLELRDVAISVTDKSGETRLAENLQLKLQANSQAVINGPSGSGKTTLLRAIVRMHPCASGNVLLDGEPIHQFYPPLLRNRIGYLRQSAMVGPGLVSDKIAEPFQWKANAGKQPSDDRVINLLEELGLDESLLTKNTNDLSGGEMQRLALIRALLLEPDILLLDESTANLDPDHQERFVKKVQSWVDEKNHAALWVTHNRELIKRLGGEHYQLSRNGLLNGRAE